MRDFLAEKLLVKIMNWDPEEISQERPFLQALASFKYNDYQQFSTGIRFIESLVRWLYQFERMEERKTAYDFLKENLIFISNEQISYLTSIAFHIKINPILIKKTANSIGIDENQIFKIINSEDYLSNFRKSLFIGLSDGSRIDQLRRSSGISNEQVLTTYYISQEKIKEMIDELKKTEGVNSKFTTFFLFDDFTASGRSYFRSDEQSGKICKFLNRLFKEDIEGDWDKITNKSDLEIHIIFYISTNEALLSLEHEIDTWKLQNRIDTRIDLHAIQIIENNIKEKVLLDSQFLALAEKYFDPTIVDRHYKKGKHDKPYLGFNECALPLILNHNTPNNSLPILWLPDDKVYRGLFPRVTRHK